jgi:multidrug transporter EmrE-like cation transporter
MSERGMLFVGLSALLTVASNLMLREGVKQAGGFGLSLGRLASDLLRLARQPLLVVGLALYAAAALVWFRVISTEKLNSCYPVLVGLTFVLVTLGATVFFHESISWQKALGLGLILTGVLLVSRG